MRINSVSFKSGLIYKDGVYYNPDTIKLFHGDYNDKNKTRVVFTDRLADTFEVTKEVFANSLIEAKNTNDIIDLSKS